MNLNEGVTMCPDTYYDINSVQYNSTTVFITQGYMFRLLNSHLQAYSLHVKSQDAVHTLGSQCGYSSEMLKPDHLSRKVTFRNM